MTSRRLEKIICRTEAKGQVKVLSFYPVTGSFHACPWFAPLQFLVQEKKHVRNRGWELKLLCET